VVIAFAVHRPGQPHDGRADAACRDAESRRDVVVSDRGVGGRELGADEHQRRVGVVRLRNRSECELGDHARAKDETVGRAAELEVTELLTLPGVIAGRRSG
jgi:hypothetical protein